METFKLGCMIQAENVAMMIKSLLWSEVKGFPRRLELP